MLKRQAGKPDLLISRRHNGVPRSPKVIDTNDHQRPVESLSIMAALTVEQRLRPATGLHSRPDLMANRLGRQEVDAGRSLSQITSAFCRSQKRSRSWRNCSTDCCWIDLDTSLSALFRSSWVRSTSLIDASCFRIPSGRTLGPAPRYALLTASSRSCATIEFRVFMIRLIKRFDYGY